MGGLNYYVLFKSEIRNPQSEIRKRSKIKPMEFKGISASPGIVVGNLFYLEMGKFDVKRYNIPHEEIACEVQRFKDAIESTKRELRKIKRHTSKKLLHKHAETFKAYLQIVDDPVLLIEVIEHIEEEHINAESALWETIEKITDGIASLPDEYLRERAIDVYDIGRRILHHLAGIPHFNLKDIEEEVIVVSHNLTPSDTFQMSKAKVKGFVTDIGGKTSHTAIIARALGIPAVVGLKDITSYAKTGIPIIVDGIHGIVIIDPTPEEIEKYEQKYEEYQRVKGGLAWLKGVPAETQDTYRIEISANIELQEEVKTIKSIGAEGIGLYRTEFLYLNRDDVPSEEEQFEIYRQVLSEVAPHPVTIRTLDLGGDKFLSYMGTSGEKNPSLGLRAIRLCLKRNELFEPHVRAILRASNYGRLRLMFPLISTFEEIKEIKRYLARIIDQLVAEDPSFKPHFELGIMIETPSAALIADILAQEVDFFSIGTNDLIQYTLVVERVNEDVAYLYNPLHPAIFRLIKKTIDDAHRAGIWVGMCGEMASDPLYTVALLGLGLDEFSVSGGVVPMIKEIIRSVTLIEAKELADQILTMDINSSPEDFLRKYIESKYPHILLKWMG